MVDRFRACSDIHKVRLPPKCSCSPDAAVPTPTNGHCSPGKEALFDALKPPLTEDPDAASTADTAARLGMEPGTVRVAILRLRRRYRDRLLAEVAASVDAHTEAEVDEEIAALLVSSPRRRTSPKSATLTVPSLPGRTFAGLMSRCTIPRACAYSSASHTARAMRRASPKASGPEASSPARSVPSTYSITKKRCPAGVWPKS